MTPSPPESVGSETTHGFHGPFRLQIPSIEIVDPELPEDTVLVLPCRAGRGKAARRTQFPVTRRYIAQLQLRYEHVRVQDVFQDIAEWVARKPAKMKTHVGWPTCIRSWMQEENDRLKPIAGGAGPEQPASSPSQPSRPRREW